MRGTHSVPRCARRVGRTVGGTGARTGVPRRRVAAVLLCVLADLAGSAAQASDAYRFADAIVDMSVSLIEARETLNAAQQEGAAAPTSIETELQILLGYEKMITRTREACTIPARFGSSRDNEISESATTIQALCEQLAAAFTESRDITIAVSQARSEDDVRRLVPRAAKNGGLVDEIWRTFPKTMALVSHIVHDGERTDDDGKVSFLKISAEEKALLLRRLDAMNLEPDKEGNRLAVEAGLSIFRDFLRQPWKH